MIQYKGSTLSLTTYLPCTQGDIHYSSLQLVQLFVQHTSTTLYPLYPGQVRGSNIVLYMSTDIELEQMLVFAFFGRSVSPVNETDMDMWLSYYTKLNKIQFENSTCDFDRNVYTMIVQSSLTILFKQLQTDVSVAVPIVPVSRVETNTGHQNKAKDAITQLVLRHLALPLTLRFSPN